MELFVYVLSICIFVCFFNTFWGGCFWHPSFWLKKNKKYLYPFLQTRSKLPQFECLRLASLGVIGALGYVWEF
jgi:hypothetical protein